MRQAFPDMPGMVPVGPSPYTLRTLNLADLDAIAALHLAAFPSSALTALGHETVRRYYHWQLTGPHDASGIGAEAEGRLAGFCIGGVFSGAVGGFVYHNRFFLLHQVITHPWLAFNDIFRNRLALGIRILLKRRRRNKTLRPVRNRIAQPSFGILAIATSPEYQGQGMGRMMLQAAEKIAVSQGFKKMNLTVDKFNTKAIQFYETLGWIKVYIDDVWTGQMIKALGVSHD